MGLLSFLGKYLLSCFSSDLDCILLSLFLEIKLIAFVLFRLLHKGVFHGPILGKVVVHKR